MNWQVNIKPSPPDNRDYIYRSNVTNDPELVLDLRNELQEVRDQGYQGTCYAQSACCMKEWQEKKDYGLNEYLSPQFFYNNRFNFNDDNEDNDYGMYGRDVMKLLLKVGICLESSYPYEKIECAMQGVRDYIKYQKRGYGRVTQMTAIDIRNNLITKVEAEDYIDRYEGKKPHSLEIFLEYLNCKILWSHNE